MLLFFLIRRDIFDDLITLPENLDLYSIESKIEDALCTAIDRRESVIADLFKSSLIHDYKLMDHIRTFNDLLLMDLHGFCNRINIRVG